METIEETVPKGRSQAQKVGKHKYEIALLHRLENRLERIEAQQRIIFHGLKDFFKFDRPLTEKVACENEVDLAVVNLIFESGGGGILAKDIMVKLKQYVLEKHRILRIVRRANRKVENAFGEVLIEKRGKKWAFTSFGNEIWGKTEEENEQPQNWE